MSDDEIIVDTGSRPQTADSNNNPKPKYKSWRKKFRKMKVHFDDCMRYNSHMFKEEQKLEALAKRIRENNDQLLDILLELNSTLATAPEARFNVKYREDWPDRDKVDLDNANKILEEAYELDQQGRYSHAQFSVVKSTLEAHVAAQEAVPLSRLEADIPHISYDKALGRNLAEYADPVNWISSDMEEDYLRRLDAQLDGSPVLASMERGDATPVSFANMTARELEREVELRNPQSVHNWLKRHNVTVGENDDKSETPASGKKVASRNLAKKVGDRAVERAMEREDGSPIGSIAGNRSEADAGDDEDGSKGRRRSRDADETYRPKGGKGAKPKRKREDGEAKGSSKKPKTSISGMSDA